MFWIKDCLFIETVSLNFLIILSIKRTFLLPAFLSKFCSLCYSFFSDFSLKIVVNKWDCALNEITGSNAWPMNTKESKRPPKSPSHSRKLYVFLSILIDAWLKPSHKLTNLYFVSGVSGVGYLFQELGLAWSSNNSLNSFDVDYPHWIKSTSSCSTVVWIFPGIHCAFQVSV